MIRLRVLTASTGACTHISLHPNELSVATIQSRLAAVLPVNDQIILLGPPYKVPKDSLLRNNETLSALRLGDEEDELIQSGRHSLDPAERTGSKRIFLFSKRALANDAPEPPTCILDPAPGPLPMPTQSDIPPPPPSPSDAVETPLRVALEVYVRQLMLDVAKGRVYADGADLRLAACRKCLSELVAIAHALRAAVSNLSDHRAGAMRHRTQFSADYADANTFHVNLLRKFELRAREGYVDYTNTICGDNESLGSIPLHPSLVAAARSSGRIMETLLDTVPLDRELAWANKCQTAHERLSASAEELEAAFGTVVATSSDWNDVTKEDLAAEDVIKMLVTELEDVGNRIRSSQSEKNDILASNQSEATRIVSTAARNESKEGGAESAFSSLEQMAKSSSSILITMESDDNILSELSQRVADAKSAAMKRMKHRLRQISIAQSDIARVTSSVSVLQHALAQLKVDIGHLEHVCELPSSYQSFLTEIKRRRAYCTAIKSIFDATVERLNSMRAEEVKLRELFLRGPGKHLMPAFYEILAPTLAASPAVFSPQLPDMLEFKTLPNVGGTQTAQYNSSSTESNSCHEMELSVNPQQTKEQSVIVSGDENSGSYDAMMQPVNHGESVPSQKEEIAERARLKYENVVLREKLEHAGVKVSPDIDSDNTDTIHPDENDSLDQKVQEQNMKISSLEAELERVRKELQVTRDVTAQKKDVAQPVTKDEKTTQQLCDKISHTSFEVGDIGLFMPTGRGRGGKRIYLAFHSNCPHRYLSPECIDGSPDFVLGRVVYQEEFTAGASNTVHNPFGLHVGTKFWVLTVEVVKKG